MHIDMAKEGTGLTEKLNPEPPILGYTDKSMVKIDFDDASFKLVKYWALGTVKWFKLSGSIILKSSEIIIMWYLIGQSLGERTLTLWHGLVGNQRIQGLRNGSSFSAQNNPQH